MNDEDHPVPPLPPDEQLVTVEQPVVDSPMQKMVEPGEPWNVMNTLAGHAEAMNRYTEIKAEFDANFAQDVPTQQREALPLPPPFINLVSPGRRIDPDPSKCG
jgi:hypothetical protein